MKRLSLTREDCVEIYYALESKVAAINNGVYNPEDRPGQNEEWIRDLEEVIGKIGPDGEDLYSAGRD